MPATFKSNAERLAKRAEDFPELFGTVNLTSIRDNIEEILKMIGRDGLFREYTLHDWDHIEAVLGLVDKLIPPDTAAIMKTADWLIIVLACYFHDLGMLVTQNEYNDRTNCAEFLEFKKHLVAGDKGKDYEEALEKLTSDQREIFLYQEFVRKNHAKRISSWINGQNSAQYGNARDAVDVVNDLLSRLDTVVRDDLARICLSHHEDDLYDTDKYKISRAYGDDPEGEANLHYAALILRCADILQIQKKRVPPVLFKLIDPSNPKSQEEWAKQAGVRAIKPRLNNGASDTIEIHASFDKESAYFGLLAYIQQFVSPEIKRCHEWARAAEKNGAKFQFPWKQLDYSQVEPRGFEGRSYKFTLDQEKILQLLTGHTLYNDSRVAIREVLQNALDAVRFRNFIYKDEARGKVEVIWNTKTRKLTIRDTGTGMTQETIENFLLNVGSSFYQSETVLKKHAGFSPISRFGIGVLATFMIADEVQIVTVHPDDEFARKLTLPSVVKSYLIKKLPKDDPEVHNIGSHGTEVILQIRRSAKVNDVESLVRFWLLIPDCTVTCKTDDAEPVEIGFKSSADVIGYYYRREEQKSSWKGAFDIRTFSNPEIDLAYIVQKPIYADVWDFCTHQQHRDRSRDEFLTQAPGMSVEGVRVRSLPAGFEAFQDAPWVFVNLKGKNSPRTNVARSDIEETPELERTLLDIYRLLGSHVQSEFNRLITKGVGLIEAAWEADYILNNGLEGDIASNPSKFREAMAELKIIALEDNGSCRSVTKAEIDSLDDLWTVDSRLIRNIDSISGSLGLNQTAEKSVLALGKNISPPMPKRRLLGTSTCPLHNMEISSIKIYQEDRGHRIDLCWSKFNERWFVVPDDIRQQMSHHWGSRGYSIIHIARDETITGGCDQYDIIFWRNSCYILNKMINELLDYFGMTQQFGRWLAILLESGFLPKENRPLLRDLLLSTMDVAQCEDLMRRMVLPFQRRFGYHKNSVRGSHLFPNLDD